MERPVGSSVASRSRLRLVASAARPVPASVKAAPLALGRDVPLDDAIAKILAACLDHFAANRVSFRETGHPESIHQMRVALRRLRAAAGLFKRAIPSAELERAAARAKSIAATLGEARDWDVFRDLLETGPREAIRDEPSFYALLDAVELRRARAYENVRAALDAPETKQYDAELREALGRRSWAGEHQTAASGSARDFAARALDRLRRRALKTSKGLGALSPERRHEARIALKKARYAAEFFESLFHAPARKYLRALAKIQDSLGADNDMEMASRLLNEIDAAEGDKTMRATGFVRGWCAHAQFQGAARAGKSEKVLKELRPFWA
jgi:CHAD domain-containing protein